MFRVGRRARARPVAAWARVSTTAYAAPSFGQALCIKISLPSGPAVSFRLPTLCDPGVTSPPALTRALVGVKHGCDLIAFLAGLG